MHLPCVNVIEPLLILGVFSLFGLITLMPAKLRKTRGQTLRLVLKFYFRVDISDCFCSQTFLMKKDILVHKCYKGFFFRC